jgi:hypothetical protein
LGVYVPVKVGVSLSVLAVPERCPRGDQRREGGSITGVVVTISGADRNGTLTTKSNYFEARLLFIRQWKMFVAQVQAQNKDSRREA